MDENRLFSELSEYGEKILQELQNESTQEQISEAFKNAQDEYKKRGDRAVLYLKEKYHDEFNPYVYELRDYLSDTDIVKCYTDGMDIENEHIEVYLDQSDEETVFYDNYFGFIVRNELENYFLDLLTENQPGEYKIYCDNVYEAFPQELTDENTLEDLYIIKPGFNTNVKIYMKKDNSISEKECDLLAKIVEKRLLESGHCYNIYLFAIEDEDTFDKIQRFSQDIFWRFYAVNRVPDGRIYSYVYHSNIVHGEVV